MEASDQLVDTVGDRQPLLALIDWSTVARLPLHVVGAESQDGGERPKHARDPGFVDAQVFSQPSGLDAKVLFNADPYHLDGRADERTNK